jgi:hypothetical protein
VVNRGGSASLIANINPGTASSNPSDFFEYEGNLYFVATGPSGRTLYLESPSGTSDPKPINLGPGVTDPQGFTEFNGKMYFSALDPADGRELFGSVQHGNDVTVSKVPTSMGPRPARRRAGSTSLTIISISPPPPRTAASCSNSMRPEISSRSTSRRARKARRQSDSQNSTGNSILPRPLTASAACTGSTPAARRLKP